MTPTLIGYFPKYTLRRRPDFAPPCPGIEEVANVACASPEPRDWSDLWLHNAMGVYDTELYAWAVATDGANVQRLREELGFTKNRWSWAGQQALDQYITRHVLAPGAAVIADDRQSGWDLYAYQVFPVSFVNTRQEAFEFPHLQVQPLPADYVHLGYDPVSRPLENEFEHSPLWCNGWCERVKVNRCCLLDDAEEAFRWARHFSGGGAEPGPYFGHSGRTTRIDFAGSSWVDFRSPGDSMGRFSSLRIALWNSGSPRTVNTNCAGQPFPMGRF